MDLTTIIIIIIAQPMTFSHPETAATVGSCIDGRMTSALHSAWNWCTQLQDKPFYPIFKLTGFVWLDGEFK